VILQAKVDLKFLALVLEHADLNRMAIRTAQPLINSTIVRTHRAAIPPLLEQAAIARFLDHADRGIRRYIRAKQKQIKLLEELKAAIIHRAVTRGLDPNVRLKPSGVEWLGDVPEHWEVRPAKWFFREVDERSVSGEEELLSVSHLTGVTPRSQKNITMFMAQTYVGHKLCRPGDLVINTMWAWMAALGVSRHMGIISPAYGVYRPHRRSPLIGDYADLLLRTRPYVSEYVRRSTGIQSSRLRLYPEQFLRIAVVCPPAKEQQAILENVRVETGEATRAIALALREIGLLRELRTRLIADVVTGKLDVREAAARLPQEAEDFEPLDEAEVEDEAEPGDTDEVPEETEA
jgi:type I restriction enzyme S subunit